MRICVISSTVFAVHPPMGTFGYSGLEVIAWQHAEGLSGLGHEVAIIAPEGSRCDRAAVIPCGPPGQWDERRAFQHYQEALPQFDVIIDHSWQKWSLMMKAEGRLKAPCLSVCHAPVNTMFGSLPPVEKPCFVCISKDQAAHFAGLFSREAKVVWNGIDLDFYKPMGVPRSNRFLFLARFSTIKGPDLAIDACRKAGVGLDLVGDTSITNEPQFLDQCKKMASDANLDDAIKPGFRGGLQIKMVGPATRGECVWWFSQAHCMLHPNQRFREPFGLAPVESMACGCPVATFDFGAMRETVINGETGWLVRSVDEFTEIVRRVIDPVPVKMRERCREWASQFSVQNMIQAYHLLCEEAVDTGGW